MRNTSVIKNRSKKQFRNMREVGAVQMMDVMMWASIVIVVMGFLLALRALAWPMAQGWMEASSVSSSMQSISNIYTGSAGFTGANNSAHANTTIFPAKYLPGGNVIQNRFGGTVALGVATINATDDTLTYSDTSILSKACPILVNQIADDADRVSVGGVIVKDVGGAVVAPTLAKQCSNTTQVTVLIEKIKQT